MDVKLLPPLDAAMFVAVRALVRHALGKDDDARADAKAAAYIVDTVLPQQAFEIGYQLGDRLTPLVLVREAKTLLGIDARARGRRRGASGRELRGAGSLAYVNIWA